MREHEPHDIPDRSGDGDANSRREEARARLREQHQGDPHDVGRTSGGGSLGHKQPPDVTSEGPIRNRPERSGS